MVSFSSVGEEHMTIPPDSPGDFSVGGVMVTDSSVNDNDVLGEASI